MKKLSSLFLVFLLVLAMVVPASGFDEGIPVKIQNVNEYDLALYIGSPLTISNGVIKPLDSDNPNVAPIIHKDRTLVPLRAIAEHFGAQVSYEAINKAAVIDYLGSTFTFYAGKNYYIKSSANKESEKVFFDTEMLIKESRSMVPFRIICENVLDKKVDYSQSIITVSQSILNLSANTLLKEEIKSKIGQAVKVSSLAQLEKLVANTLTYSDQEILREPTFDKATDGATGESASPSSNDFSSTNIQVAGIDEADVVKTDGSFIYIAAGGMVKIIKADNGKMEMADMIKLPSSFGAGQYINITDLYVDKNRLVILGSFQQMGISGSKVSASLIEPAMDIYPPIWQGKTYTYCAVYSVSENGKVQLLKELSLEGSMLSSRKNGDTLYLITNKYLNAYYPLAENDILPMYKDSFLGEEYNKLSLDRIMCYPDSHSSQYLLVAAVDIRNTDKEASIEAILGSGSNLYMNDKNLYIGQTDYSSGMGEYTAITKFSINGTKIGFAGGGKVKGSLLNQFSMDEYMGNLRVATTSWGMESTNSLYILDSNLNKIGQIENLAPGERIFAVRFMGAHGYIVTFRQVDPLFVIDLSNAENPKVTGELKVPGFSNFLYPIEENILLGVGQGTEDIYTKDSSGKEVVIGTRQTGIKFSIFDVSDQGKPKELHSYTIGDSGSYSEVLYNHKALMFKLQDNLLAFDATLMDSSKPSMEGFSNYFNGAAVLTYSLENGFKEKGRISYKTSVLEGPDFGYFSNIRRLCYIGDVIYYIQDNQVRSFNIDTLEPIDVL